MPNENGIFDKAGSRVKAFLKGLEPLQKKFYAIMIKVVYEKDISALKKAQDLCNDIDSAVFQNNEQQLKQSLAELMNANGTKMSYAKSEATALVDTVNTFFQKIDKFLANIVAVDGKVNHQVISYMYLTGAALIGLSLIVSKFFKPDLSKQIDEINKELAQKNFLSALKKCLKFIMTSVIVFAIFLPGLIGITFIALGLIEQFTDIKIVSALAVSARNITRTFKVCIGEFVDEYATSSVSEMNSYIKQLKLMRNQLTKMINYEINTTL